MADNEDNSIQKNYDGHFKKVFAKLEELGNSVTAIDTSIQGDENRGVIGMKQHVTGLKEKLDQHIQSDSEEFYIIKKNQISIKGWVAGAVFVATLVVSCTVFIISNWDKMFK